MFTYLVFSIVLVMAQATRHFERPSCDISTFPPYFKFGAGSSAYQVEGAWNVSGKSRSWWDWFTNSYPEANNNATGNIACDSYHKNKEDIKAMKKIGINYYRFSLSWTRILPKGFSNNVSQAGVDYYNNLLDDLMAAGIMPMVTIFHWDIPLALEHLGGWTSPTIIDSFVAYADLAFKLFGNKVKLWSTVNEPDMFCQFLTDFTLVDLFPETPVGTIEYLCGHHVILAHARTYRLYQEKYKRTQKGRVSLTLNMGYSMPLTNSREDHEATERENQFTYGWFAHPVVYGDYPEVMKSIVARNSARQKFQFSRLPKFTSEEKRLIRGSYDLFFLNYYTAQLVTTANYSNIPSFENDKQTSTYQPDNWPTTAVDGLVVYPKGIKGVLRYIKQNYNNPDIWITENGYSDKGGLNDTIKIGYIKETLRQVRLAMCEDGVHVSGYTYWSFLDSFEWDSGYIPKFGLVQVDFDSPNLTRTIKESGYYYNNLIRTRNINSTP